MTKAVIIILMFCSLKALAQNNEQENVRTTIETFFEGFHKQDSTVIKQVVADNIILQSIGRDKKGNTIIKSDEFSQFIKSIVSIPSTVTFEEKILGYNIQIDGNMANVWTPYEFWLNDQFSHCGVNSFQLVKMNDAWKIIYLIDTRRKEGCEY